MNRHAALLTLAVYFVFAPAHSSASTPAPGSAGLRPHNPALYPHLIESTSPPAPAPRPANPDHLYMVSDAKGLVLTCIAPEIDTNVDTDLFKGCTLAPGRTLDDVMHAFIQGIHYEQSQHQKEREQWLQELKERTAQKQ